MTVRKMKKGEWSELLEEFKNSFYPDRALMSLQVYGEKVKRYLIIIKNTESKVKSQKLVRRRWEQNQGLLVTSKFKEKKFENTLNNNRRKRYILNSR